MSEAGEHLRKPQRMIRYAFERIDPAAPVKHLVENGKPLTQAGAELLARKNATPPAETSTAKPSKMAEYFPDNRRRR